MPGAEFGDTIHWGSEEIRVGHDHRLERLVNGLTEEQWIERQLNTVYLKLEEAMQGEVAKGLMTQEAADWHLSQCVGSIRGRAAMLFGDIEADLKDLC